MKRNTLTPSPESQQEALKIARATQKPGQTKEQTKLIAQGIEKGIALYKKQQKERHRQADKARKKQLKLKSDNHTNLALEDNVEMVDTPQPTTQKLPWVLLALSWLGFAVYLWIGS
ncbi:DUF2956 domain-containing protein [Vibrio navarrensis]|uniref:DUF2956 domain-containing protein n=1 Tax=Vibrio navarrensis TaxID=29495 RepID=A0AAI9G7W3_9VIBR|nr:DUF2956 domain-containing protein [Vibrio navarrensis]EGR2794619.1 DUF2956 domain-containing protein [Vibrio navarrensis]EJL6394102.1 DUF2956 domain-containing protein [Vibrio navarrensis]EKA5634863.1 DUF2956 domain-containing protein [Vibrio navarrensis]ELN6931762.1 DUF2956 domain-containing protein [Vibrio navarrensis]MBE4619714.1 hypothetical protein [Vibrio navarrensis]